jgi:hypothetical protein
VISFLAVWKDSENFIFERYAEQTDHGESEVKAPGIKSGLLF